MTRPKKREKFGAGTGEKKKQNGICSDHVTSLDCQNGMGGAKEGQIGTAICGKREVEDEGNSPIMDVLTDFSVLSLENEENYRPEEFQNRKGNNYDTVIEMGEEILGLPFPLEVAGVDMGHYLAGGGGLHSLSEVSSSHQPQLTPCSSWDAPINLCHVQDCARPADKKCSACKRVFYCGEQHQSLNWSQHQKECNPFRKALLPDYNASFVLATRDIPAGELIFSEKPILLFPLVSPTDDVEDALRCLIGTQPICSALSPACFGCNTVVEFVGPQRHSCSSCFLPLCSHKCEYFVNHQLWECEALKGCQLQLNEINYSCFHSLFMDVEIIRALRLQSLSASDWNNFLELEKTDRVMAYRSSSSFASFEKYASRLVPISLSMARGNIRLITSIHSIIRAHSFRPNLDSTWKAVFRTQGDFPHSCIPNTFHFVENEGSGDQFKLKLVCKAAVGIGKEEMIVMDTLPSPYLSYAQRKSLLLQKGIDCGCQRCTQPSMIGDFLNDIRCTYCRNGYIRPEDPLNTSGVWACVKCMEEVPLPALQKTENRLENELNLIPKTYEAIPLIVNFLRKARMEVHPSHSLLIRSWCFIESLLRNKLERQREPNFWKIYDHETLKEFQLIGEYCEAVLPHLEAIKQGLWIDKGIVLFLKFYSHLVSASRDFLEKKTDKREFTGMIFKCLKILESSLHTLILFEGMEHSGRLIHEATHAFATLKQSIREFILSNPQSESQEFRTPSLKLRNIPT